MSLFKRPGSPYWQCEFQVNGKRIARSTGTKSRRDAAQFERELKAIEKARAKVGKVRPAMTLDIACGRFWEEHGHRRRDHKDVKRHLLQITQHMDPDLILSEVGPRDVSDAVASMRKAHIGEIAINRAVTTLQGVINRAAKVWEEPTRTIDWGRFKTKEQARETWLTPEECAALISELPEHIALLVEFMIMTGLRRSEAFNLRWEDVSFERRIMMVDGKGGKRLPARLNSQALAVLARIQIRDGKVFNTTNWRKHFDAAKVAIGQPTLRWHDLRHTCASLMGQHGASLDAIKRQLRHSSIAVTQKYRHVADAELDEALERLPTVSDTNVVTLRRKA